MHAHHHQHPTEIRVTPVQRALYLVILVVLIYYSYKLDNYFTLFAGFVSGIVWFFFMHWSLHQKWIGKVFPRLLRFHIQHHCKHPDKCFGVSVTWWDDLFDTIPKHDAVISEKVINFYFDDHSHKSNSLILQKKDYMNLSVVIICKNGAPRLGEILLSIKGIGNETLVYDSGSNDESVQIAKDFGAKVIRGRWEGYGKTRYKAAQLTKNDWILMLDTDEVPDQELRNSILSIDLQKENRVYNIRYKNFYGDKWIRYGEWGNDSHIRMANRKAVQTDQEIVHEKLFLQQGLEICTLKGYILHYTVKNTSDYAFKMLEYARLSAEKYKRQGRHSSFLKISLSPLFSFIQNYFFKLGFLDGWPGFVCARMTAWYTFLKYVYLKELQRAPVKREKTISVPESKKLRLFIQHKI